MDRGSVTSIWSLPKLTLSSSSVEGVQAPVRAEGRLAIDDHGGR
jgi:hypothetical protein